MVDESGGVVKETMIEEFKKRTEGFGIALVDKYNQEMAIM